jgi:hypothetical protein
MPRVGFHRPRPPTNGQLDATEKARSEYAARTVQRRHQAEIIEDVGFLQHWGAGTDDDDEEMEQRPAGFVKMSCATASQTYKDSLAAREQHWRTQLPGITSTAEYLSLSLMEHHKARQRQELAAKQQLIQAYQADPVHFAASGTKCCGVVSAAGKRNVHYRSTSTSAGLDIPKFHCSSCGAFDMPPVAAACVGNAPLHPKMWWDMQDFFLLHFLKMNGAISTSAFTSALNDVACGASWLIGSQDWNKVSVLCYACLTVQLTRMDMRAKLNNKNYTHAGG